MTVQAGGRDTTDLDGATNGSIDDPVAIAVGNGAAPVVSTVSEGGGGGGCVLKPAADKDITFPMFLLASLGYLYRRRSYCRSYSLFFVINYWHSRERAMRTSLIGWNSSKVWIVGAKPSA